MDDSSVLQLKTKLSSRSGKLSIHLLSCPASLNQVCPAVRPCLSDADRRRWLLRLRRKSYHIVSPMRHYLAHIHPTMVHIHLVKQRLLHHHKTGSFHCWSQYGTLIFKKYQMVGLHGEGHNIVVMHQYLYQYTGQYQLTSVSVQYSSLGLLILDVIM